MMEHFLDKCINDPPLRLETKLTPYLMVPLDVTKEKEDYSLIVW